MSEELPRILELRRLTAPVPTPQALASHEGKLWVSSRDERRLCAVEPQSWETLEETSTPGIAWAAVPASNAIYFTSGEGADDDRYLRRFQPGRGFDPDYRVELPERTGSYLSFDGDALYVSQWYKHRVLRLDGEGRIQRTVEIGEEICGHAFAGGQLYVLCGTEQGEESWRVARVDLREEKPAVEAVARVPFACRSLAFDGERFWTNHRAQNQTVAFVL